jgi:hypothetical protein
MRESEAKFAGRMLAYNPSDFLRARRPCSGRTGLSTPHFGPPTEPSESWCQRVPKQDRPNSPIRMASTSWHALRVAAGKGSPNGIDGVSSKFVSFQLEFERSRGIRDGLEDLDRFRDYFRPCIVSTKSLVRSCPET